MANDFTTDPSCKALWRMESGALTVDSISTNTLTTYGSPAANTSNFKEGASALSLNGSSSLYINEANLAAGFPFKSTDSVKQITLSFWINFNSVGAYQIVWSKTGGTSGTTNPLWFGIGGSQLSVFWPYGTTQYESWASGFTPVTGRWYHLGLVIDGGAKTVSLRVYDSIALTVNTYSGNYVNTLYIAYAGPLTIGAQNGASSATFANALFDEFVVFNRLLGSPEIDAIRLGTYPPPPLVEVDALGIEVGYKITDIPNDIMVIAAGLEVGYKLTVDQLPPANCRSLSTVGTCPIVPPASCRSLTTVQACPAALPLASLRSLSRIEAIAAALENCRSLTRCPTIPSITLGNCRSLTICQPLLLAIPHACVSKTRVGELPPFNDGLFLIF